MKRIALFITVLGLTSLYSRANFEFNGLFYDYVSTTEKTVAVTGFVDQVDELTVPDSIEVSGIKYAVRKIGLGQRLFGENRSPRIIHLPPTIREISSNAFKEWSTLESIDFSNDPDRPNQLTTIGMNAFYESKDIKSVILPESPFSIEYAAFEGCSKMEELDLGGAVSIGAHAFYICTSIKSILLPRTVTKIGEWAFSSSAQLESIAVEDGNECFDSRNDCNAIIEKATCKLVVGCSTTTIPEGTKIIGERAFYGCRNLTTIEFPNTIETIDRFAFSTCSSLKTVNLPESLIYIKQYAFYDCTFDEVTIPENVENIGSNAFFCNDIKQLNYNAINCKFEQDPFVCNVSSTSFGENVKYLNSGFNNAVQQVDIVFPNSLIGVSDNVLTWGRRGNLSFGSNLRYIYGFSNITSLKTLTILSKTPPKNSNSTFGSLNKAETLLYVPIESIELYKNDNLWSKFFIVGVDGIDGVENDAGKVIKTNYYDLSGREMEFPVENKIMIRVSLYDNGKTKSEKIVIPSNSSLTK